MKLRCFVLLLVILWVNSCQLFYRDSLLQSGDILFRAPGNSALSGAIDAVTHQGDTLHYTHMGIVYRNKQDQIMVYHATPFKGVCSEPLQNFLLADDSTRSTVVQYRLKSPYRQAIPDALQKVSQLIGQPYNETYIIEDSGYYCSELIYEIFLDDSLFRLNPMTFKDGKTGAYHKVWVDYYQSLGIPVPEGLPGCNPNQMARSDKLIQLRRL